MTKQLGVAALIIVIGIALLLESLKVTPHVGWVWVLGLFGMGLIWLWVEGKNKLTVVICPLMMFGSLLSLLRQLGHLTLDIEVPLLVIALGVLIAYSQSASVPSATSSQE